MSDVEVNRLSRLVDSILKEYLFANEEQLVHVSDLQIVGSYDTEEFVENESDIDIIIKTDGPVSKDTKEYFWQYFNDCPLQKEMQSCVSDMVERVDCVGIEQKT